MNQAGLFILALTCLVGVVLGLGKGGTYLPNVNPYMHAGIHTGMPFPPPFIGGYGYGAYGFGRRRGFGGLICGVLGFFLFLFILMMLFGLLLSSTRALATTGGGSGTANNNNNQRQVIVVHDNGVTSTNG